MLLLLRILYTSISGSEIGRMAVRCECGISDRLYKMSVTRRLTVQLVVSRVSFFKEIFFAQRVYTVWTRINYRIVPVTNLPKYLHYGTSGTE
jgi:hypothetical protein